MKVYVFEGKRLGREKRLIKEFDGEDMMEKMPCVPNKGDTIYLPTDNEDDFEDGEAYIVNSVMMDYVHNEYVIFAELYDWED